MEGIQEGQALLKETATTSHYVEGTAPMTSRHSQTHRKDNEETGTETDQSKQAAAKRELMKRKPSLEKVDEDLEKKDDPVVKPKFGCQNLSSMFGVKSYLHHFYETHSYKDPDMYEDDAFRYLLHPQYPRRRRHHCTSIWWKVFVWIGANFLVFGVIGVLVGYLVPQRPIIVGAIGDNIKIMDKQAIPYNFNLDICKLVGLILFCIGGLTLTVALLFPSFFYHYCDDDRRDGAFRVSVDAMEKAPLSPTDRNIPASSKLTNVQPERKNQEAIVTQEGMMPYQE